MAGVGLASPAQAALIAKMGGAVVYDTDLKISWLANANLASTNTFGLGGVTSGGLMNWVTQQSFVAEMNAANYLGFSDWRLPSAFNQDGSAPCNGYNCSGSELGHLFYTEIRATRLNSILTGDSTGLAKFNNVQSYDYWTGTQYEPGTSAWLFTTDAGAQVHYLENALGYIWPVRSGDVAVVPEPVITWLLGIGAIAWANKKSRAGL